MNKTNKLIYSINKVEDGDARLIVQTLSNTKISLSNSMIKEFAITSESSYINSLDDQGLLILRWEKENRTT